MNRDLFQRALPWIALSGFAFVYYITSPRGLSFWWSDATRHAMTGVFLADVLRDLPISDPLGYAERYYAKYPAIAFLFYPPLYHLILGVGFSVFGPSQAVAIGIGSIFAFAYAAGVFALARRWLPTPVALAGAVLAATLPEVLLWGRQVMLDVPYLAMLAWAGWALAVYAEDKKEGMLWLALMLCMAATFTKLNALFFSPLFLIAAHRRYGWGFLRERTIWMAALAGAAVLLPFIVFMALFNPYNVTNLVDHPFAHTGYFNNLTYYLRVLPDQMSWPLVILSVIGTAFLFARGDHRESFVVRILLAWTVLSYTAFTLISVKEPRHSLPVTMPLSLFAAFAVWRIAPSAKRWVPLSLAVAFGAWSIVSHAVPRVDGYAEVARAAAQAAPAGTNLLFSGYRDGNFIFALRTETHRADLSVLRADRMLLDVSVYLETARYRERTQTEILSLIENAGIDIVVLQPGFQQRLQPLRELQELVESPEFQEISRHPINGNFALPDREIVIYRRTNVR